MWTRVDTGLRDHRKVRKLARLLKIEQAHALGLVVGFWLFSLNNWGHGVVDKDPDEIAHAACWAGDPQDLVDAFFDAGFLENKNGVWLIEAKASGMPLTQELRSMGIPIFVFFMGYTP